MHEFASSYQGSLYFWIAGHQPHDHCDVTCSRVARSNVVWEARTYTSDIRIKHQLSFVYDHNEQRKKPRVIF